MARKKLQPIDNDMILGLADKTFVLLPLLSKRLLQLDQVQTEQGLPLSQLRILHMLYYDGTLPIAEISRRLGVVKPNVTPVVDVMIAAGYVERTKMEGDRRKVNISLLPAGREKMEAVNRTMVEILKENLGGIRRKDFQDLDRALTTVLEILEEL